MSDFPSEIKSTAIEHNTILDQRYLLQRKVATGGMGNIYRAEDTENKLPVAVKILHKGFLSDAMYLERFKREVEMSELVNHPNVVKIFELVQKADKVYFTMEFIEGVSLEQKLLSAGPLSPQNVTRILMEIADGLSAIHAAGIVHRDIKPANIMLQSDGSIKIIDFGISRDSKNSRLTTKNVKVGSMLYIPPEIWLGKPHNQQADFYSLGCALYELCTGEMPFYADDPIQLMELHRSGEIPELPQQYPNWMNQLLKQLLAKKPQDRPESAKDIMRFIKENCPESEAIQTFSGKMQNNTIRSGQSMISVFDALGSGRLKNDPAINPKKLLVFSLQATRPAYSPDNQENGPAYKSRSRTILLKLPNKSGLVFYFELPSKDFLFLGIFLASLNAFDWYLTHQGVTNFGVEAEGNNLLKEMMLKHGAEKTLMFAKGSALMLVFMLTIIARRSKAVKNVVATLSIIYLVAAVIPWIYILYYR